MNNFPEGSYGYDASFLNDHGISTIELRDKASDSRVLLSPGLQGRVMTSSSGGDEGRSYGWINHELIRSGKISTQFNPFGGEERFWLGPEGGPFSVYFKEGEEQIFANWKVPGELDTIAFDTIEASAEQGVFQKSFSLVNASGTKMETGIRRTIRIFSRDEVAQALNVRMDGSVQCVGYESDQILTNTGREDWNSGTGFLSVWMLGMFNPSEKGVVFIPFRKGSEKEKGKKVTDDYFGRVPSDRLVVGDDILFFKTDGKFRSKIGIPPERASSYCGSYDPINRVLTILWFSLPEHSFKYVNSLWGPQEDTLSGDAVNAYNDGPNEDGAVMGPFYELESSSPAAMLKAGEQIRHSQRIFHLTGDVSQMDHITKTLFGFMINDLTRVF